MMSFVLVIFLVGCGAVHVEMPNMTVCTREAAKVLELNSVRQAICVDRREMVE